MRFESKYDIGDVVYLKSSAGVSKGTILAIAIDPTDQTKTNFTFVYLIWESDRHHNAGHCVWAYENNLGRTFEEAYYESSKRFPWEIDQRVQMKHVLIAVEKMRKSDNAVVPQIN